MKDPLRITLGEVKSAAVSFLKRYHPSLDLPIPIEEIVEIKLGIQIIPINGLIRNFGVNAFITQDFERIIVDEMNYKRQPERMHFTFSEEIGHKVLHEEWYRKNGPEGLKDYLKWQKDLDGKTHFFIENQAKTFGSMILMPEKNCNGEWSKFSKMNEISVPCGFFDLPDTFPELASKFGVTTDALLVRLSKMGLVKLPDGFWEKVRKAKNR